MEAWYESADWWVAIFTGLVFVATVGLWIFTALMWVATKQSLSDSRAALASSRITADVAQESLQNARREQVLRLRPYVFLERVDLKPPSGLGQPFHVQPVWINTGQTPAKKVTNSVNYRFDSTEMDDDFNFFDAILAPIGLPLPPGRERIIDGPSISTSDWAKILSGSMRYSVYGWIEYSDVFEGHARYRTEFSCNLVVSPSGYAFINTKRFNGADDECERQPQT